MKTPHVELITQTSRRAGINLPLAWESQTDQLINLNDNGADGLVVYSLCRRSTAMSGKRKKVGGKNRNSLKNLRQWSGGQCESNNNGKLELNLLVSCSSSNVTKCMNAFGVSSCRPLTLIIISILTFIAGNYDPCSGGKRFATFEERMKEIRQEKVEETSLPVLESFSRKKKGEIRC